MTRCPLTRTELQVLRLLATGLTYKQIAERHGRTVSTIRSTLHNIYRKTGIRDRSQLVIHAYCHGWIELPIEGRAREEMLLSRVAMLLDHLMLAIETRQSLTTNQTRYLHLFESWLRADTHTVREELRERMADQVRVVLHDAGLDPNHVGRVQYRRVV